MNPSNISATVVPVASSKLAAHQAAPSFKLATRHVGASSKLISSGLLDSLQGGQLNGFQDLEVPELYVRLAASYKDPHNWSFEMACQPVALRCAPSEEMLEAVMDFVRAGMRATAFLNGAMLAADGEKEEEAVARASICTFLLSRSVIVPQALANANRNRQHRQHKDHRGYNPEERYVVAAPEALLMRAVQLHSRALNDRVGEKELRVPAPWRMEEPVAALPGEEAATYTMADANKLVLLFNEVMATAAKVDEVPGMLWPLQAVTPRPPTALHPHPTMSTWVKLDGWDHKEKIHRLLYKLENGRATVQTCVPEVRMGGRDGPIFQAMENPQPVRVGTGKVIQLPALTTLPGVPPLAKKNRYLTELFLPREDILNAAPELRSWLVGNFAAEMACLQSMSRLEGVDRLQMVAAAKQFVNAGTLPAKAKDLVDKYPGFMFLAYLERQHANQVELRREELATEHSLATLGKGEAKEQSDESLTLHEGSAEPIAELDADPEEVVGAHADEPIAELAGDPEEELGEGAETTFEVADSEADYAREQAAEEVGAAVVETTAG